MRAQPSVEAFPFTGLRERWAAPVLVTSLAPERGGFGMRELTSA